MKPSTGRIVHVRSRDNGQCVAAIVTVLHDPLGENIGVTLFPPGAAPDPKFAVMKGEQPGDWHWPERENG